MFKNFQKVFIALEYIALKLNFIKQISSKSSEYFVAKINSKFRKLKFYT